MGKKVRLEGVRLGFAHGLFRASSFDEGQQPKYGCDLMLVEGHRVVDLTDPTKPKVTTMTEVLKDVANDAWKGKGVEVLKALESSKKCLRKGDSRLTKGGEVYEGYEGINYVTAKNKHPIKLRTKGGAEITEADGILYSGCFANAIVEIYAMTDPKKKGVHATLTGVQFVKDGDAFAGSGARFNEDDFDYEAGADAGDIDNTASSDDDFT